MKERKIPWWLRKKDEIVNEESEVEKPVIPVIYKDYTTISIISRGIADLLIKHLVPSVLSGPDAIGLCSPAEHGDMGVTVYLYDVRENEEMRGQGMIPYDENHLQPPPMYLNLYYMITAFSDGAVRYRQEEEQRILGKVMETLYDNSVLDGETLFPSEMVSEFDLRIHYQNLGMEDKTKIWNQSGIPYRLSLFYMISPVALNSKGRREVSRVKEIRIDYEERE